MSINNNWPVVTTNAEAVNNGFQRLSHQNVYAINEKLTVGLTFAYCGIQWGVFDVTPGTITLTNNATNYITVARATGEISASTLTDNWNDVVNHAHVYIAVAASGSVTYKDFRVGPDGVLGYMTHAGGGGGGGGGGAYVVYPDSTAVLADSTQTLGVISLTDSATEATPATLTGTANNNTVLIGQALRNGQIGDTELRGGKFTVELFRSVDNSAGETKVKASLYLQQVHAGTVTVTGTGTSRTATVTGGTPFVAGHADADPSKCSWLITSNAVLRITGYTSATEVTVECKSTYTNNTGDSYSIGKYVAQGISADINDTVATREIVEFFFNTIATNTADYLVMRFWATTTATSNRTVTINYGGASNYTNITTTLSPLHNSLAGLNQGDFQHLTAAEKTMLIKAPLGGNYNGKPTASFVMMRHPVVIPFNISAGMTGSIAKAEVAATAQTDFDCQKNGVSFGTIRFAAAGTTATFIAGSQTSFVSGDVLKVIAPVTPDATLEHIGFTFLITKVA